MTIRNAIAMADELEPNQVDYWTKVQWLNDLDQRLWLEVIETHEGIPEGAEMPAYGYDTDVDTDLLAGDPWAAPLYSNYIRAMVNEAASDSNRYNASVAQYMEAYRAYTDWYNRTHMPIYKGAWKF